MDVGVEDDEPGRAIAGAGRAVARVTGAARAWAGR